MEIINTQTNMKSSGEIYEFSNGHENIGSAEHPLFVWIATIKLSNGFVIRASESELAKVYKRMTNGMP